MITLKIPYKTTEENSLIIKDLRRQYSCVVRYAYNRVKEGLNQKEIRILVKELKHIELGSWISQCAIMEGIALYKKNKDKKVVFGGAKLFIKRIKNKITKDEFKEKRLNSLSIQGEKIQSGNRNFDFSYLNENKIIFKVNKTQHLELELPKLNSNYRKKLEFIQERTLIKDLTVSIRLNEKFIYLMYEEEKVKVENLNQNRYLGIDLNPNYIGICIKENDLILHTQCFDFKELTDNILKDNSSADSKRFKYLNNKLKYETLIVSKEITKLAKQYKVKFIFIEDLKNISKANLDKGHVLNRLTKNLWKRDYFVNNLEKRISLMGMKLFKVNPMYSSVIGNVQNEYIDPVNASLEIARRGYHVIIMKDKQFYPAFAIKGSLRDQWKEHLSDEAGGWKELFKTLKNFKLRYRVSLEECKVPYKVFQMCSNKSKIKLYSFI